MLALLRLHVALAMLLRPMSPVTPTLFVVQLLQWAALAAPAAVVPVHTSVPMTLTPSSL